MRRLLALGTASLLILAACSGGEGTDNTTNTATTPPTTPASTEATTPTDQPAPTETADVEPVTEFSTTEHGQFNEGWSMEFTPDGNYLLVGERVGTIQLRDQRTGEVRQVSGVPQVHHAGQAGFHDIIVGPNFDSDGKVFISWVSPDGGPHGFVASANLDVESAALTNVTPIWEQDPASGNGHFSLRMLIQDDHLFITSGERQKMAPAQDHGTNLGKVLRLTLDGVPVGADEFGNEGVDATFYTLGHRNPLGIAEDSHGQIWVSEMGPEGGDELNLLKPGANYGWPEVSNGSHYGGEDIPDHADGDGFEAPKAFWNPSISPGNLEIYSGDLFTGWKDSALLGGLSGQTLVCVQLDQDSAEIVDDWDMGNRIREVEEAPDGTIWVLEDKAGGRLLELKPN